MKEIRERARERMKGFCRVCPVCDGKACAGEVPGMGGVGTGSSFRANIEALADRRFRMRLIHDVKNPDPKTTLLGFPLSFPVLAAPIGGVAFNIGEAVSEADYIQAVLSGCREAGIVGCTGDGVPEIIHKTAFSALKEIGGYGIPFIKPWEDKELFEKLESAMESGVGVVGMDIDAAGLVTLAKMGRPVSPKSPDQLAEIIEKTPAKFVLKGIMTPEDAKRAVDVGAAGIVVSNHGGRVLDTTPGVADVLPAVAGAVRGQIVVLADGGVRSGGDVLKMLALGADAVMIGRPLSVAAMGGLLEGVSRYLEIVRSQLIQSMILTGCGVVEGGVDATILQDSLPR